MIGDVSKMSIRSHFRKILVENNMRYKYIMVSKCPKGMIRRKGYTANRRGKTVKVASNCIKATSAEGTKRSVEDKAYFNKRQRIHEKIAREYGEPSCGPGKKRKEGYTREGYERRSYRRSDNTPVSGAHVGPSKVAPTCINERGGGTGYKIPLHLKKNDLARYGYSHVKNLSVKERHDALTKAAQKLPNALPLYRKLVVLSTLQKHIDPDSSEIFRNDAKWVKDKFGLMKTPPKSQMGSTGRTRSSKSSRRTPSRSRPSGSKTSRSSTRARSKRSRK